MRVSTSKSTPQVGGELLSEAKDFKYIRVLFRSDGKIKFVIDKQLGMMLAVMKALYQTVVVKRELRRKAKLSNSLVNLHSNPHRWS